MTLDVLICTLGHDGIKRVVKMDLPVVENVKYIISWQLPDNNEYPGIIPQELCRKDISVFQINNKGLSINRNNAISHSSSDICLIADDDLKYTSKQLSAVIETFNSHPDLDIATFKYSGNNLKKYPKYEFDLTKMAKDYYITSFEIAFRRTSIADKITFSPYWGLGAETLHAGEEALFLHQALHAKLNCRFFPITITVHNGTTTGNRFFSPGVLMAQGAFIAITHPATALLRIPLFAWRNYRRGLTKIFPAMRHLWDGYIYGKRYFNHDGSIKNMPPK